VQWNTPQGKTTGKVKNKLTSSKKIKSHVAKASKENPEYLVQSEKSGKPLTGRASCVKYRSDQSELGIRRR
jgi:hypothetical protein